MNFCGIFGTFRGFRGVFYVQKYQTDFFGSFRDLARFSQPFKTFPFLFDVFGIISAFPWDTFGFCRNFFLGFLLYFQDFLRFS